MEIEENQGEVRGYPRKISPKNANILKKSGRT